ncbi:hypothetical protein V5799_009422, partial [Amblyomma americanum]
MMRQKKCSAVKVLVTLFPRIPKVTTVLLEFFIKRENKVSLLRDPLSHFCQEQSVLAAQDCLQKLHRQFITYQDIRDMVENLMGLHSLCLKRAPITARSLGLVIRKLTIIVGELATSLEKISEVPVTDWMAVGDAVVTRTDKDAYVTVMEYVCGVDLMRVVERAVFLPIDQVRVIMAQLVLAVEHLHLKGFLHRDIKVSNMLMIPGGRVKLIDFDTNKVCLGHCEYRNRDESYETCHAGLLPADPVRIQGWRIRRDHSLYGSRNTQAKTLCCVVNTGSASGNTALSAGRACDWWSTGVVFYKLMTGRVPFRGKTKKLLRDRIIASPLKWPKVSEHPHSATTTAKDMVYLLLKKNPVERLGSKQYRDIKSGAFQYSCRLPVLAQRATEVLDTSLNNGDALFGFGIEPVIDEGVAWQDMNNILQSCGRQTLTLTLVRAGCRKGAWYGFTTFEAKTWDQSQKAFSRVHIIQ